MKSFNDKKKVPELLAPAGSADALVAAVQNGADAVYLGLSTFNARASAENFTLDSLKKWLDYAHLRGAKIHITLNTLLYDDEIDKAVDLAKSADALGADAFIVQDLGLATRLAGNVKAELHASTQATVYNIEGMKKMRALGFQRAVLARELPLEEIAELSQSGIIDTEAFCHGALCMSYSGQCMLSKFTTGRSGNRGTCAQPCRLKYARARGTEPCKDDYKYILSPADLCSLEYMEKLVATGVSSLKIEGRLKSPEYAAAVTGVYRKIIDDPGSLAREDIEKLTVVFSRGGFCSGHQLGKMPLASVTEKTPGKTGLAAGVATDLPKKVNGPVSLYEIEVRPTITLKKGDGITFDAPPKRGSTPYDAEEKAGGVINVISKGTRPDTKKLTIAGKPPFFTGNNRGFYKTYDEELYTELRKCLAPDAELKKVPLTAYFSLKKGEQGVLTLTDNENRCVSALTQEKGVAAEGKSLDAKTAEEKLTAFGGTPFYIEEFSCHIEDGVFIGFSSLKALRREATEMMIQKRTEVSR
ncbi:MAG: U32 family peptidase [Clostridia bacterium]|nr:U32 family peptidase [Clostridia bacterium]